MTTPWGGERLWATLDRLNLTVGRLPILQFNAILWGTAFLVTTGRYAFDHWIPSVEWMGFLTTLAGGNITHFYVKRNTDTDHVTAVAAAANGEKKDG